MTVILNITAGLTILLLTAKRRNRSNKTMKVTTPSPMMTRAKSFSCLCLTFCCLPLRPLYALRRLKSPFSTTTKSFIRRTSKSHRRHQTFSATTSMGVLSRGMGIDNQNYDHHFIRTLVITLLLRQA